MPARPRQPARMPPKAAKPMTKKPSTPKAKAKPTPKAKPMKKPSANGAPSPPIDKPGDVTFHQYVKFWATETSEKDDDGKLWKCILVALEWNAKSKKVKETWEYRIVE